MTRDEIDARRYRWLRHKLTCGHFSADEELAVIGAREPSQLDSAVDASIADTRYELTDAGEGA